jgi:hypothetical protein
MKNVLGCEMQSFAVRGWRDPICALTIARKCHGKQIYSMVPSGGEMAPCLAPHANLRPAASNRLVRSPL